MTIDPASPVALQIPVRPEQLCHVTLHRDPHLSAEAGSGAVAADRAVVQSNSSPHAACARGLAHSDRLAPALLRQQSLSSW